MTQIQLTETLATRFAAIALAHVDREYPNKIALLLNAAEDLALPRDLYPLFWGSFDWHSCVHAHWLLAAIRRRYPDARVSGTIAAHFDRRFTLDAARREAAGFDRLHNGGFERPYGWAWLLMLAGELHRGDVEAQAWGECLRPLTQRIVAAFHDFLPRATFPVRSGAHFNTAFAIVLGLEYAHAVGDSVLASLLARTAMRWYADDQAAQAWEPSGDDFLSPTLIEAEAMRRTLPSKDFLAWFDRFLPQLAQGKPSSLLAPVIVSDRSDGKIAHLDGLHLSRAWCLRSLAAALPDPSDPRRTRLQQAADIQLQESMPHVSGDYMGEHWLASFAWLALTASE